MAFTQIRGQSRALETLSGYLETQRLSGAYLFIGPKGIGKSLAARNFAKVLNCLNQRRDACDKCPSCLKIEQNQHPDFHLIQAAESEAIKIEAVRDLKKEINLKAYLGRRKIFLIEQAHNLTPEAQNALLKVLEEPAGESTIILVTDKPALLFKTIISRCQIIRFSSLKRPQLEQILKDDYALDGASAHFLAYFCEGSIGRALQFKDSQIFREKNQIIDAFALSAKVNPQQLAVETKEEMRRCLNILAAWFRDIYLIKIGAAHSELIHLDRRDELLRLMQRYSWFELEEVMKFIADALLYLEQNVNLRLLLSNLRMELWKERL